MSRDTDRRNANMLDSLSRALEGARPFAERLFAALQAGSRDERGGVTRASYGEGEQFAHRLVAAEAKELGLRVSGDAACNTYMTLPGSGASGRSIVIGSHLDSVAQGGNYDGAAGVVAGLAVLKMLKSCGFEPACDLVVMGVRAEESAWFQTSYIGSKAALGLLEEAALSAQRVDTGRSLAEHIALAGGRPQQLLERHVFLDPGKIDAYIEVHIEQAPSLVHAGNVIAVGTAIPGNFRYKEIRVRGETAHVGLPRRFRRDALKAAVDFVGAMDDIWQQWETAGRPMALTVGRFHTDPDNDAMTKVPGEVRFSIDVRAYDEQDLAELHGHMQRIIAAIEERRGVSFDLGRRTTAQVARMDEGICDQLHAIARQRRWPVQRLPSPASHDAAVFCAAGVPTGLLLIRNEHGSHNPREALELDDFMAAVDVLARWIVRHRPSEPATAA